MGLLPIKPAEVLLSYTGPDRLVAGNAKYPGPAPLD